MLKTNGFFWDPEGLNGWVEVWAEEWVANDMYNNDVGKGGAYDYEAYEAK